MFCKIDAFSRLMEMDCCSCFGVIKKPKRSLRPASVSDNWFSRDCLLNDNHEDSFLYNGEATNIPDGCDSGLQKRGISFEEVFLLRTKNGMICREVPVKETCQLIRTEDENGNKMVNEYVRECKIGSGSYGKVVLHRSNKDGKQYAIKVFHKSHLLKLRVTPSETAMTDVLREVSIMKMVCHPNVVNLVEVIDDPNTDQFYMVLEYVEGKWVCEGSGPAGSLGKSRARRYLRDIIAGLRYLHTHNIVHGDIKPDNLLVTSSGAVKIGDFGVSQVFEDDNDELRRSPGTPVFTAPECCSGITYHGKAADTWALGVTLYFMVLGEYPFLGETLQDTYDKIVNDNLCIPEGTDTQLKNLVEGILCKDPEHRMTLDAVAGHPWVVDEEGPIPQHACFCKRRSFHEESEESISNADN